MTEPSQLPSGGVSRATWAVTDYDLAKTLNCGQAFRWRRDERGWQGVVAGRWVRLSSDGGLLRAETALPQAAWQWLEHYLQLGLDWPRVLRTFPDDAPMRAALAACRGLRLLRQDPWECLASFLLSATKQIVQIQTIIERLCQSYGARLPTPAGSVAAFSFPTPEQIASLCESDLRACKMGFRAPHLLGAARAVAEGRLDLEELPALSLEEAREHLKRLKGVGPKIADCVLLFGCGFPQAFPVDVWINRALRELYFRNRKLTPRQLGAFAAEHFGPHAGYAQQYLFHYMRTRGEQKLSG